MGLLIFRIVNLTMLFQLNHYRLSNIKCPTSVCKSSLLCLITLVWFVFFLNNLYFIVLAVVLVTGLISV